MMVYASVSHGGQRWRHKTKGPGSILCGGSWKSSGDIIVLSSFTKPELHSASNRNEYQEVSLGVKRVFEFEVSGGV